MSLMTSLPSRRDALSMVAFTIEGRQLIGNGELLVIHELRHKGLSISAIARRTGLDRKTGRSGGWCRRRAERRPALSPRRPGRGSKAARPPGTTLSRPVVRRRRASESGVRTAQIVRWCGGGARGRTRMRQARYCFCSTKISGRRPSPYFMPGYWRVRQNSRKSPSAFHEAPRLPQRLDGKTADR